MELSAPLLKNYLPVVKGKLAGGGRNLPSEIFDWGEHPMFSEQLFRIFSRRLAGCVLGVFD
jgi:hypothetical protein